jgi:hypothetical protein
LYNSAFLRILKGFIMSILSYPDRGPWGKSSWRGNCSGHIYKELFERLSPKVFVDPMVGSGTSVEVAKEMGIEAYGLDLHSGFNCLRDSILGTVGKPADLVVSHPPYGEMIKYSGGVWGDKAHPDDLSHCLSDEDFHNKLQLVLMNQREATRSGGFYGTIIGDLRKDGRYVSYQAETIARMPASELAAVIIKAQHNTQSASKSYGRMALPFITHEYILLWKRKESTLFGMLKTVASQAQARLTGTWKNVVKMALMGLGGKSDLPALYAAISNSPKALENDHWKEKVRQVLNQTKELFTPVERGVWALA